MLLFFCLFLLKMAKVFIVNGKPLAFRDGRIANTPIVPVNTSTDYAKQDPNSLFYYEATSTNKNYIKTPNVAGTGTEKKALYLFNKNGTIILSETDKTEFTIEESTVKIDHSYLSVNDKGVLTTTMSSQNKIQIVDSDTVFDSPEEIVLNDKEMLVVLLNAKTGLSPIIYTLDTLMVDSIDSGVARAQNLYVHLVQRYKQNFLKFGDYYLYYNDGKVSLKPQWSDPVVNPCRIEMEDGRNVKFMYINKYLTIKELTRYPDISTTSSREEALPFKFVKETELKKVGGSTSGVLSTFWIIIYVLIAYIVLKMLRKVFF